MEEFRQKREDLNTQCEQSETSLLIVEIMNGVCVCMCVCVCARTRMHVCTGSLVSHTSLHCISECVQLVMEDAKKRKSEWEQQLPVMKLTNLLQLRDALMATACIHMMRLEVSA